MSWESDNQSPATFFVDIYQGYIDVEEEEEEEESVSEYELSEEEIGDEDDSSTSDGENFLESSEDEESHTNPNPEPCPSPSVTSTTQETDPTISLRVPKFEVNVIFDEFGVMSIEIEKELVQTRTVETQTPIAGPDADLFAKKVLQKMLSRK